MERAIAALAGGLGGQEGTWAVGSAWLTLFLPEGASPLLWLCVLQTGEGQLREEGLLPKGEPPGCFGVVLL